MFSVPPGEGVHPRAQEQPSAGRAQISVQRSGVPRPTTVMAAGRMSPVQCHVITPRMVARLASTKPEKGAPRVHSKGAAATAALSSS